MNLNNYLISFNLSLLIYKKIIPSTWGLMIIRDYACYVEFSCLPLGRRETLLLQSEVYFSSIWNVSGVTLILSRLYACYHFIVINSNSLRCRCWYYPHCTSHEIPSQRSKIIYPVSHWSIEKPEFKPRSVCLQKLSGSVLCCTGSFI